MNILIDRVFETPNGLHYERTEWIWVLTADQMVPSPIVQKLGDDRLKRSKTVDENGMVIPAFPIIQGRRAYLMSLGKPNQGELEEMANNSDQFALLAVSNPATEQDIVSFLEVVGTMRLPIEIPEMPSSPNGLAIDPDTGAHWTGDGWGEPADQWPKNVRRDPFTGEWSYEAPRLASPPPDSPYWNYFALPLKAGYTEITDQL